MTAGRRIIGGRYELEELPLGEGGMGEVYKGYDQQLDRRVAVKLLRFPLGRPDEMLVKRFRREARAMARLEHPGAPTIYDADVFDDPQVGPRPFLVMQFVEGITLDDIVGEHEQIPVGWAAAVAAQVAAVLCAAHNRGILHRDLKPSNLMICRDGTVKVLDFGLAMFHDAEVTRLTMTGAGGPGTPAYMSPEQIRGAAVGPQSDLYALGLVLHEILTGRRVCDGQTVYRIFEQQVNEPAPSIRLSRPEVPEELDELVLALLEKRAEDRPAQAEEVYRRLLPFATEVAALPGTVEPGPSAVRMYARVVGRFGDGIGAPAVSQPASPAAPAVEEFDRGELERARRQAADLVRESRHAQAVEVLEAVLGPASRVLGTDDEEVLALRLDLAGVLFEGGDYRRAAPVFGGLHRELTRRYGLDDDRVLHCRRQEATCLALMGQTGPALRLLRALLAEVQEFHGPLDSRALELRRQIGLLEMGVGDTVRARRTLSVLLDDLTRLHGPEHPDTVRVRDNLARLTL